MTPHARPSQGRGRTRRSAALALGAVVALTAALAACDDHAFPNFNDPTIPPVIAGVVELQQQATGLLIGDREQHAFETLVLETMGRDAYRLDIADPRYVQMPLGNFSPSAFLVDFSYNVHYRVIKGAQAIITGLEASPLPDDVKAGGRGFAYTLEALQYLRLIETRDTLGVPIALGTGALDPIRCKAAVLELISAQLDSGATELAAGGSGFAFQLPAGFSSNGTFDTPETFAQFNRGLAAKALVYRAFQNFASDGSVDAALLEEALTALDESFEDPAAPFRNGVYHTYSTAAGDLTNGNFDRTVYRANPKVVNEAEAGDARLSKILKDPDALRAVPDTFTKSDLLFTNITGPTTPSPILINEELILIRAEALWGLNRDQEALDLVNVVRQQSGGLPAKSLGAFATHLDLLREILKQKRYSLLFESGSRLVDYRMFGLFAELGLELNPPGPGPKVIPFPQSEIDARGGNLSCTP